MRHLGINLGERREETGTGIRAGLFTMLVHRCAEGIGVPGQFRSAAAIPDGLGPLLVNEKATIRKDRGLLVSADRAPRF